MNSTEQFPRTTMCNMCRKLYNHMTQEGHSPTCSMRREPHPQASNPQWFDVPQCLADLWRYMVYMGWTPNDAAYFMEKPYKWQSEWESFLSDHSYRNQK